MRPEHDRGRPGERAAPRVTAGDPPSVGQTVDVFARRLLLDCLAEATASYWNRRAEMFSAVGTDSCDEIARACRARAAVSAFDDERDIVAAVLREVS